jgi:hypothetical protein
MHPIGTKEISCSIPTFAAVFRKKRHFPEKKPGHRFKPDLTKFLPAKLTVIKNTLKERTLKFKLPILGVEHIIVRKMPLNVCKSPL